MIAQSQLDELSLKHHLTTEQAERMAAGFGISPVARRPETVHGFLSREEANAVLASHDMDLLVNSWGLGGISNHKVVFLAGEGSYGFPHLKNAGFSGMTCKVPSRMHTFDDPRVEDGVMRTAEDFLRVYFSDCVHLNSMQELLDYLNHGTLPHDARPVSETMAIQPVTN